MSKIFSGKYVIKVLEKYFGFEQVAQKGSHIKLEKVIGKEKIVTIVPNHKELQSGTLLGILDLAKVDKKDFLLVAKR